MVEHLEHSQGMFVLDLTLEFIRVRLSGCTTLLSCSLLTRDLAPDRRPSVKNTVHKCAWGSVDSMRAVVEPPSLRACCEARYPCSLCSGAHGGSCAWEVVATVGDLGASEQQQAGPVARCHRREGTRIDDSHDHVNPGANAACGVGRAGSRCKWCCNSHTGGKDGSLCSHTAALAGASSARAHSATEC